MSEYKKLYLIILITTSIVTHFLFFGQPRETVFDEVHFGKFISGYFTHEYFFDIHPPLGKLMLSGIGYISGFKSVFSFAEIGQQFPDRHYLWLRLLPTIAGALLPVIIYFLILQLGFSPLAAFAGGLMVVLENALLVQSRFILLDAFLLLFGFSSLLFYFLFKRTSKIKFLILAGVLAALAISVKWTGATFLILLWIFGSVRIFKSAQESNVWKFNFQTFFQTLVRGLCALIIIPAVIYFSIFVLHFALLTKSGPGDAFMTPQFRKTLAGSADSANSNLKPLNTFQKFNELNLQMYKSNATLTAGHPYSSKWYTWPFMIRPIYYWNKASANNQPSTINSQPMTSSRIYFLGNPVIWWMSTVAIIYLLINLIMALIKNVRHRMSNILSGIRPAELMLGGAFILNLLPFIGIKRAMFLYHYMVGLVIAIIALVYLIDKQENKKRIFVILLAASFTAFIFFAPLTYGLPLTEKAYNLRIWLKTWL